jgi:RHS repeat-associated protein
MNSYVLDALGRVLSQTNANNEALQFTYNAADELLTLTDGKSQTTSWNYDEYGRVTNKVDAAANIIFKYAYDGDNRLTNRWTPAKGTTSYSYDNAGNLTSIRYPISSNISLSYDSLNRLTNMVDGVGATKYSYDGAGALLSEDGPWTDDTVSYSYANRLRTGMSLLSPLSALPSSVSYTYDDAKRLTSVTSPAGTFSYGYNSQQSTLVSQLTLPGGSFITNTYDSTARLLGTWLEQNDSTILNSHVYAYDQENQRTQQVFTAANYVDYSYDPIGQLRTANGKESGGLTNRTHEQFGYAYDSAGNLNWRTNNDLLQNFSVNSLNELASSGRNTNMTVAGTTTSLATNVTVNSLAAQLYADSTFARTNVGLVDGYNTFTAVAHDDLNGNMLSDGHRAFDYDDENELVRITVTNAWKSEFNYDGKLRRRIRKEFTWTGSWTQTNEVRYVYDGNLVFQERWLNPQLSTNSYQQLVTYTRGRDLSGSLEGAGGIGGLLARSVSGLWTQDSGLGTAFYHADGNGNITCLVNSNQAIVAKYIFDPYGNILSISGTLAEANLYRFSSKEVQINSSLAYYLYRYYEPRLQRWLNRDPLREFGFEAARRGAPSVIGDGPNLYAFVANAPISTIDLVGLKLWKCSRGSDFGLTSQHVYLWDDTANTSCGRGGSPWIGRGMHKPKDLGPGRDTCVEIPNSAGKESAVMGCCRTPRTHLFVPLAHDCHNWFDGCLGSNGLSDPDINGRFTADDIINELPPKYIHYSFLGGPWP